MCLKQFGKWGMLALLLSTVSLMGAGPDAPLADAAKEMNRAKIRALLEESVDVNAAQVDGMTALHWAAYQNDLQTVEMLVRAGANVEAENRYGVKALSLACQNGNTEMVELLLEAGADPNTALPGGETALMTAARTGKLGPVKALLARGADVQRTVEGMRRPRRPGAVYADQEAAALKAENSGQTALMWAAAEGHAEVVKELIKAGADFQRSLSSGFTPLLFAARQGHIDVARTLLEAGADVNEFVQPQESQERRRYRGGLDSGTTPLLLAVKNAHFELAAYLLEAGADPNGNVEVTGYTPLHAISKVRKPGVGDNDPAPDGSGDMTSIEFVKKLAEYGADLNARMTKRERLNNTRFNEIGATPFMLASLTADAELMKTLADLGADPLIPNEDNSTPLMAAAGLGTRSPGEDAGTEPEVLEAVKLAIELGNDINAVDNNGETVVHAAAYKNLPEVTKFLAEKADIESWYQKNKYGWTPLAIAVGYRFGNFKPSPVTEAAIREVMMARGVTPPKEVQAETQQIY